MKVRADLSLAYGTAKGPVRSENQDDYLAYEPADPAACEREGRLFAVADGMGGLPGGAEASRAALRGLLAGWLGAAGEAEPAARLLRAFARACRAVADEEAANAALAGLGTTLTAIVVVKGRVFGVHAGDSRCLRVRDGRSRWLTSLHLGGLSEHQLTRAVGAGRVEEDPELFEASLRSGDLCLLMSDGLWRALPEEEVVAVATAHPPAEAVERLLQRAQLRSGEDNATLLFLRVEADFDPELPRAEVAAVRAEGRAGLDAIGAQRSFASRSWPWLLLVAGLLLGLLALVETRG